MVESEISCGLSVKTEFLREFLFGLFALGGWLDNRALLFGL